MSKAFRVTLGILTAVGGFVDIGDLVASVAAGARFGMALAWAVIVGLVGIMIYAEMAGRVTAVSGRPVFEIVRERMGARTAAGILIAVWLINFLTVAAEIAGVALALQLASDVNYLLWIPLVGVLLWLVIWRMGFELMERLFGLAGLALVVVVVAVVHAGGIGHLVHGALHPLVPSGEGHPTYFYLGLAVIGSANMPYELIFFSSGAGEERWTPASLGENRANVFVGFPLGAVLSLALMAAAAQALARNRSRCSTSRRRRCPRRWRSASSGWRSSSSGSSPARSVPPSKRRWRRATPWPSSSDGNGGSR